MSIAINYHAGRQNIAFDCPPCAGRIARVEVFDDMRVAEPFWHALERDDAWATPYQRFDLLAAWHHHVGARQGIVPFIVTGFDLAGRPLFLWPFGRKQLGPLRVAGFLGSKHASFNVGLWRRDLAAAIGPDDLRDLLARLAGGRGPVDLFALYDCLLRGYLAAALIAAAAGIVAYFHLFGSLSDPFVLYGRARGTFNDPNVLGAFLVLPAVLLFQRVLIGRASAVIRNGVLLMVLLAGLLLTFSRAAWGQFALSALVVMALCIVTAPSAGTRIRIVFIAIMGAVLGAIVLGALLAIPQVSDLFAQRATLDQSYDVGHFGRFGRYVLGAELGLERPFGIGPLQFSRFFGEDPHNSYLNAFMSGGWLSGFAYLTLTATTLAAATRFLRAETPWRSSYQLIYAAYLGVAVESAIIDIDHWRHYFLILGAMWGLISASSTWLRSMGSGQRTG